MCHYEFFLFVMRFKFGYLQTVTYYFLYLEMKQFDEIKQVTSLAEKMFFFFFLQERY